MKTLVKQNKKTNQDQETQNKLLNKALLKSCENNQSYFDVNKKLYLEKKGRKIDPLTYPKEIQALDDESKKLLELVLDYTNTIILNSKTKNQRFYISCEKDNMIGFIFPKKKWNNAVLIHVNFSAKFLDITENSYVKDYQSYLKKAKENELFKAYQLYMPKGSEYNPSEYKEIDVYSYHARFIGDINKEKQVLR